MHGKKKWIVRYDGKLKRSRHRTFLDWAGPFVTRKNRCILDCKACDRLQKEAGMKDYFGWARWSIECPRCDLASQVGDELWRKTSYISSWCGRQENRYYRASVKQVMNRGKFDDEAYENMPVLKKNVRYNYD